MGWLWRFACNQQNVAEMVLMTSEARSREVLQFLRWPLEHPLSEHSLSGYSLLGSSCYAVTSPQHVEAPRTDTLVSSLAELPANSQHELPPQEGSPWTSFLPSYAFRALWRQMTAHCCWMKTPEGNCPDESLGNFGPKKLKRGKSGCVTVLNSGVVHHPATDKRILP